MAELDRVFFTDETAFHLSGYVNSRNTRICSSEYPRALHALSSVVCCVTSSNSAKAVRFETTANGVTRMSVVAGRCHMSQRDRELLTRVFFWHTLKEGSVKTIHVHCANLKRHITEEIKNTALHKVASKHGKTSSCVHY